MTTDVSDGAWMTYGQLADARQITRRAAIRLAQRRRWRREKGNDGFARVFVPAVMTTPRGDDAATIDAEPDDDTTTTAFETALAAIEAAHARELASLQERVAAAEQAQARAQGMVEQLAGAVHDMEVAGRVERARLQHDLDAARAAAQTAQEAAEALRLEASARKARGLAARLRAAWRGA
jgi:hypothetical protein